MHGDVVEDRKITRTVKCLRDYSVAIAGLQETHWFGNETYTVGGRTILTCGWPTSTAESSSRQRGEGVALLRSSFAANKRLI